GAGRRRRLLELAERRRQPRRDGYPRHRLRVGHEQHVGRRLPLGDPGDLRRQVTRTDPQHVIALREVETDRDLELWARIKSLVVPNQPVTAEQLRRSAAADRLLLLATLDGSDAGCGIADRSDFGNRVFIAARVLPEHRRRGVATALVRAL